VVHEGASVFAAPDGGAWARAFESTRVRIVRVGSQRWVRVLRVDGIADDTDCELRHAWVRSEDVVVPR
jgi:hypothetical protein